MAIETEFKFVMKNHEEFMVLLETKGASKEFYHQIYISDNARFRMISNRENPIFTYKQMINGRLLEIESDVTKDDWEVALDAAISALSKWRYVIDGWECDFILDKNGQIVFVMVEREVPEGTISVDIPEWMAPYVELAVPFEDNHYFTNKRLTDLEYAKIALDEYLKKGHLSALKFNDPFASRSRSTFGERFISEHFEARNK